MAISIHALDQVGEPCRAAFEGRSLARQVYVDEAKRAAIPTIPAIARSVSVKPAVLIFYVLVPELDDFVFAVFDRVVYEKLGV